MEPAFKKINFFRDRLQIALNFFDIFNEEFEPLSLDSKLDLSKCYLPLISAPKNFIQKSNISLALIDSIINFEEKPKVLTTSRERIMRNILKSYFINPNFLMNMGGRNLSKKESVVKYCYEFLCDIGNLHNLAFLQNFSFSNFEEELQYKSLEEDSLHVYMDKLYLIDKKPLNELNQDDKDFLLSFFADSFLLNFTISLTFLLMNMMFFLVGFNDNILKKVYLSNREDPELSIIELVACKEFNVLKDFAIEFLQNKESNYYSYEIFSKYHGEFLSVVKNVYYLEDYAKILLYSKINIGYEKINIILG